jgi:hypothetical protein
MTSPGRTRLRLAVLLGVGHLLSASLPAQPATKLPAATPSNSPAATQLVIKSPELPEPPPPPPAPRSPIGFFRELLAMNAAERKQALTNYTATPERRTQILAKVREYESLKPDDRELRLRVTELRWYLRPLMTAPATNRATQLALIPQPVRQLVEDRLREWDKLPPDVQKDLLGLEPTLQYFAEIEGRNEKQRLQILTNISPARRAMLEKGVQQWSSLSEDQRRKTLSRFDQFFQLNTAEKDKALKTLSEPERRQIEKTLQVFGSLPSDQRSQCIRSFAKFASLSLAERQQFLKNAERWKLMPPSERQAWRELVDRLPPPLPPDPSSLPPLPPSPPHPRPRPVIATNAN